MNALTTYAVAAGAVYLSYSYLRNRLVEYLWAEGTVLNELSHLGELRPQGGKIKGTAVIAGCSLTGLVVARVCADHFERVVVVDPEQGLAGQVAGEGKSAANGTGDEKEKSPFGSIEGVPVSPKRSRVAQYTAIHALQTISLLAYRKYFPDWDQKYKEAGGIVSHRPYNLSYSGIPGVPFNPSDDLPDAHYCARPVLETLLRRCLFKTCSNVNFVAGTVVGVNKDVKDATRIASVSIKTLGKEEVWKQEAVLVADCCGPIKSGLKWLSEAGFGGSTLKTLDEGKLSVDKLEISYHSKLAYSGNTYAVTPELAAELDMLIPGGYYNQETFLLYLPQQALGKRAVGFSKVGKDIVSLYGAGWGETTPDTEEDFRDFFQTWKGLGHVPDWIYPIMDVLFKEKPIALLRYRDPPCIKAQYERAANLPSNFVALGDAYTRFNPVFGQGTSHGVLGSCVLDDLLRSIPAGDALPPNFSETFFARHAKKVSDPLWMTAQMMDYGYKTTVPAQGDTLKKGSFVRWYSDNVLQCCSWSPATRKVYNDVWMFVSPPAALFAPNIIAKVLYQWMTGRVGM